MRIRSKEPYWLLRNGIINSYPSLRKNIEGEVLVVGGGITGALISYQLSSEGYKTIIIDKRDVGTGSTSATTSMVQYELDEPLYGLMDSLGKEVAIDIYKASVEAVYKLGKIADTLPDCGFARKESLHFADTLQDADGLQKEIECRKMAGIKVKWLTQTEIAATYGLASEGGILSEIAASMDAFQLTHALLEYGIKKYGVQVYDHTELVDVQYGDNENLVTVDTGATIQCKTIIYATGYESHEFIRKDIGKLISTYACISEPFNEKLPASLTRTVFWNTQDPYFYFRTTFDNRLLIGGADESFRNPEKRDALIEKKEKDLVRMVGELLPGMEFVADFTWAGTFGVTKDTLPYIGPHPDFPNSYFMLGYGGNGITFSVMGMEILSDALAKRPNKFLEYFKFKR